MPEQVIIEAASDGAATKAQAVLVANTDHTLAAENHSRDRLIVSAGVADAWLAFGVTPAVVGQGVAVRSGGEPYVEEHWKGEVHIISTGAATIGVEETSFESGDDEGERQAGADTFTPSGPSNTPIPPPTAPPAGTPFPPQ